MNANQVQEQKRPIGWPRPFPWRCRHCGKNEVQMTSVPFDAEVRLDGRDYAFTIPSLQAPACRSCKQIVFTESADEQISAALRAHLHLLTPDEIRARLQKIGLSPKEAAERLGIAEETLTRWMDALQIQSPAMDNLLRVFFGFPEVRNALVGNARDPHLGMSDAVGHS